LYSYSNCLIARDIIEFCRTKTEYFENNGYMSTFSMYDLEEFESMIHDSTVGKGIDTKI
jgi:hypothetical protein